MKTPTFFSYARGTAAAVGTAWGSAVTVGTMMPGFQTSGKSVGDLGAFVYKRFFLENTNAAGTMTISGTVYSRPNTDFDGSSGAWIQEATFGAVSQGGIGSCAVAAGNPDNDWMIVLTPTAGGASYKVTVMANGW